MEYSIEKILEMNESLTDVESTAKGILGFAVSYNKKILSPIEKQFTDFKNDLIIKYHDGEDALGNYMLASEESAAKATKELMEFGKLKFELNLLTIPETLFISSDLTAKQITALDWMSESMEFEAVKKALDEEISKEVIPEVEENTEKDDDSVPYNPKDPVEDPRFV